MNCRATCFLKTDSSLANENGKPQNESSTRIGLICLSVMLANKVTRLHHHLPTLAITCPRRSGSAEIFFIAVVFPRFVGRLLPNNSEFFVFLIFITGLSSFRLFVDRKTNGWTIKINGGRHAKKSVQVKLRETQLDRHEYTPIKGRIYTPIQGWTVGLTGQWPETGTGDNALSFPVCACLSAWSAYINTVSFNLHCRRLLFS